VRLILRLLGLGLIEHGLEGARIDLHQEVALIDDLAFGKSDLVDLAVDPRPYLYGVEALDGAEPGQIDREISFLDRRHADQDRISPGWTFPRGLGFRRFQPIEPLPAEIACSGHRCDDQNPEDRP